MHAGVAPSKAQVFHGCSGVATSVQSTHSLGSFQLALAETFPRSEVWLERAASLPVGFETALRQKPNSPSTASFSFKRQSGSFLESASS